MMMLIVGLVQYWTCAILCLHSKPSEMDVNDTILRILGPKWYKANLTTNVLLLYIVCKKLGKVRCGVFSAYRSELL